MKKVLSLLFLSLMASASFAIELPEPVIIITEGEEFYIVDVEIDGDYEVRVFCDNTEIETPYAIERLEEDAEHVIRAFAQLYTEEGWSYSDVVEYWLLVPAREGAEPTPYPYNWVEFEVTKGDEYYTVRAYCYAEDATVRLYCDGIEVDNPCIIERSTEEDMYYEFTAWSYCEGYGDVVCKMSLIVPGIEKPIRGDLNGDGEVNIADVNAVIDAILNQNNGEQYDFDGDGEVTVSDVMALISFLI